MSDEAPTTGQILGWVWENKDRVLRRLKVLREWFRGSGKKSDTAGILILGAGGVGKNTLARLGGERGARF